MGIKASTAKLLSLGTCSGLQLRSEGLATAELNKEVNDSIYLHGRYV